MDRQLQRRRERDRSDSMTSLELQYQFALEAVSANQLGGAGGKDGP